MIEKAKESDVLSLMEIWLKTNIKTHSFVDRQYWIAHYNEVKEALKDAEVYVYREKEEGMILGFIGLDDTYIAGIFVKEGEQSKGIGKALLNFVKDFKKELRLHVYQKNKRALSFYLREGFQIKEESEEENGEIEILMEWSGSKEEINIRFVSMEDEEQWFQLDHHLSKEEFSYKCIEKRGLLMCRGKEVIGLLRFSLFWDQIPFCNLLMIDEKSRLKGYGRMLMEYWETIMKEQGYDLLMVSTQVNERAQDFYRKLGYKDCGGLLMDVPKYKQPMELFLLKEIK